MPIFVTIMSDSTSKTTALHRFFGSGRALTCIQHALRDATVIRIATAYFEPTGYNLLRATLQNKEVRLLLGRDERSEEKIEQIVNQFIEDLSSADIENKTQFLQELLHAIQNHYFTINLSKQSGPTYTSLAPKFLYQHAKLYIADCSSVVVTSANLTYHGLVQSREAGIVVTSSDDVEYFVKKFDEYFEEAESIAEELLQKLEELLALYSPYQIYIRSLLLLYQIPEEELIGNLKFPPLTGYQRPIVSRIVRTVDEHQGAMLVASTGLGKTVMAAHIAAYMRMNGSINSALVLCPAGLKNMWHKILRAARISSEEFSYYILSVEDFKKSMDVAHLLSELSHIDDKTLIILDESHHMRNIGSTANVRLSHQRIKDAVNKNKATILLMTATPYSTGVDDINAQLMLLPFKEDASLFDVNKKQWEVKSAVELSTLPPVVVLTSPTVVKYYSSLDENGNRYVLFLNNEKRYFPQKLHFQNIEYSNQCDVILHNLLQSTLLYHRQSDEEALLFANDAGNRAPLWEAFVVHQGCSSLKQMDELLSKLSYEGGFEKVRLHNQQALTEFAIEQRKILQGCFGYNDEKIKQLLAILQRFASEKVVIFCHYRETARYIKDSLNKILPQLKVETTVDVDPAKVESMVKRFAPRANRADYLDEDINGNDDEIQVLVATGAMSEGFNFQDARVLINFDMPWTVLTLAQRMGRILRPWFQPRDVYVYNFIPSTMEDDTIYHASRWKGRLISRNRDISSFAEIPVLVTEQGNDYEMINLAKSIALFGDHDLNLDEVLQFIETADKLHTSSFIDDIAMIDAKLKRVILTLPMGIRSIKQSQLKQDKVLYILFKCNNRYYPVLFDKKGEVLYDSECMDDIMNIIRSSVQEEAVPSALLLDEIDAWILKAKNEWMIKHRFDAHEVMIDCTMVIVS